MWQVDERRTRLLGNGVMPSCNDLRKGSMQCLEGSPGAGSARRTDRTAQHTAISDDCGVAGGGGATRRVSACGCTVEGGIGGRGRER
jgi:hypothetical protein